jgi:hypothetical protein
VEADRTVNVQTTGDAGAILGIEAADRPDDTGSTPNQSDGANENEYVSQTDGTVEINLDGTSEGANGLNQRAITTFRELVTLTNNGTQTIQTLNLTLNVPSVDGSATATATEVEDVFEFTTAVRESGTVSHEGTVDNTGDILSAGKTTLEPGDTIDFGLIVNLISDRSPGDLTDLPGGSTEYEIQIDALTN